MRCEERRLVGWRLAALRWSAVAGWCVARARGCWSGPPAHQEATRDHSQVAGGALAGCRCHLEVLEFLWRRAMLQWEQRRYRWMGSLVMQHRWTAAEGGRDGRGVRDCCSRHCVPLRGTTRVRRGLLAPWHGGCLRWSWRELRWLVGGRPCARRGLVLPRNKAKITISL